MSDLLVWVDCEMTGLDLTRDALIEIACIVTDSELAALDDGLDLVIKPPAEALESMPDVVREMHTASGLLGELSSGLTLAEAQDLTLDYVRGHVTEPRKVPLCGTRLPPTARSSPGTCPSWTGTCTTGWSTCPASRSWRGAGTRAPTTPARKSAAGTGRWPTSGRASGSCATTARRSSCRSPGRTRRPPGRLRPAWADPAPGSRSWRGCRALPGRAIGSCQGGAAGYAS